MVRFKNSTKFEPFTIYGRVQKLIQIQYKLYRQNRVNRNKGTPKSKRVIKKKKGKAKIKTNK